MFLAKYFYLHIAELAFKKEIRMASETKKMGKISRKILAVILVVIIAVAVAATALYVLWPKSTTSNTTTSNTLPAMSLTLVAANGTSITINQTEIGKLTTVTSAGGLESSGGAIEGVGNYTGVPILTLLGLVGGMTSDETLTITATDGYSMVFTYDQVNGQGYPTFDPVTGNAVDSNQTLTLIAAYYYNDVPLTKDIGPIRIALVGSQGLLTEGHFWIFYASTIAITSEVKDWNLTITAISGLDGSTLMTDNLTRQAFAADQNPSHFEANYTDQSGNSNNWTGTTLYHWISWANYDHPTQVSNASLANGYKVVIISGDGSNVTLNDSQVYTLTSNGTVTYENNNIIVASELNGNVLSDPIWPLNLVGSDINSTNTIGNIVEIEIILDNPAS